MSGLKRAAMCTVAVLACMALVAAPASAASYPTSAFGPQQLGPSYGASWARGTVTWFNRSVVADGEMRTAGGCLRLIVQTGRSGGEVISTASSSLKCGDAVHPIHIPVPADVTGGAAIVVFCFAQPSNPNDYLGCSGRYRRP